MISLSDRDLASPTSHMSLDGAVAAADVEDGRSPGVKAEAVLRGIKYRLDFLRTVEA